MSTVSIWTYRDTVGTVGDFVGLRRRGDRRRASARSTRPRNETSRQYLVVDTGFWIFGKKRLIPAGVVDRVDHDDRKVYVSMTKDQIK